MLLSTTIGLTKRIEHVWLMVSRDFTTKTITDGITTLDTGPSMGGHNLMCLSLKWLPNKCGLLKTHIKRKMEICQNKIFQRIALSFQMRKSQKLFAIIAHIMVTSLLNALLRILATYPKLLGFLKEPTNLFSLDQNSSYSKLRRS